MADIEPQQTDHLLGDSFPRYIPRQRDSHARSVGVSLYSRDVLPFASAHCLCIISSRFCLWTMANVIANGRVYLLLSGMAPFQRKVRYKTRDISTWPIITMEWKNTDHCQM